MGAGAQEDRSSAHEAAGVTKQVFRSKRALITGASGGIGLELAREFASDGWDLILVARSAAKLADISQELSAAHAIRVECLPMDLSVAGSSSTLFEACRDRSWRVDALVNNAGIGSFGLFHDTPLSESRRLLDLNIVSLTELTRLFMEPMIRRGEGYILNVASTAAFQPGPLMAVYYASKAYVLSFSEALSNETRGTGVHVSVLCPGATATGFQEAARMGHSKLFKRHVMSAEEVARKGYRGLIAHRTLVVPGLKNKLLTFGVRFSPRWLVPIVVRKIQESDKTPL